MRILLIEDDPATSRSIELMLASAGFVCETSDSGEDGIEISKLYDYDAIILDLMLPDMDGHQVLHKIRVARVHTPILILSGLRAPEDRIKGLTGGADDYLTKPFDKRELVARIHALVRRANGYSQSEIRTGKLVVNLDTHLATVDGRTVNLTGTEYAIVELLSLHKGSVLTKGRFFDHLYGGMDEPAAKVLDVFLCKLRKKLAAVTGGDNYIETVWGRGYVMRDPPGERRRGEPGEQSPDEMRVATAPG